MFVDAGDTYAKYSVSTLFTTDFQIPPLLLSNL